MTSEARDIVEREVNDLRAASNNHYCAVTAERLARAAATIEQQAQEIRRLREALEKIAAPAKTAAELGCEPGFDYWCTVADNRKNLAREALPPTGD